MQRNENSVYINNGVNGQQADAIHMGYGRHSHALRLDRGGLHPPI